MRLADACLPITATHRALAERRRLGACDERQLEESGERGNRTANREPVLSDDSSDTLPPCVCATHDAMASPEGRATATDLRHFASGGVAMLTGEATTYV